MNDSQTELNPPNISESNSGRWDFLKNFVNKLDIKQKTANGEKPPSHKLVDSRNKIIQSVVSLGLRESNTLTIQNGEFFGSIDKNPHGVVFGRVIPPPSHFDRPQQFQGHINMALYNTDNSCIPVVTERPSEGWGDRSLFRSTKQQRDEISDRAFSSLIVVFKSDPEAFYLWRHEEDTKPENIAHILVPRRIYDEDPSVFASCSEKTIVIDQSKKGSLFMEDPILMPDYESAIKKIVTNSDEAIFIHAVRLPVESDLQQTSDI